MRNIRLTMLDWTGYGRPTRLRVVYGALFALVLLATLFAGLPGEVSASVVMVDLGTLGGTESEAVAVNASGQVVGWSEVASGDHHAFSWTQAGGMIDLGTLGGAQSEATAVNATGQVVGWANTADGDRHAFLWTQAGEMVDLGPGNATAVNDSGQVVGQSQGIAFSWTQAGGMVYVGLCGDRCWGPNDATAVNDSGQVVGEAGGGAFSWTQAGGLVGIMAPGVATAVNASGQVVGWGVVYDLRYGAFSWTQAGGWVEFGTLLGSLCPPNVCGLDAFAAAVNDSGQVVGSGDTLWHRCAFLWTQAGGIVNLGIMPGHPWNYSDPSYEYSWSNASAVNAGGQVVGFGTTPNRESPHAFSWTRASGMVVLGGLGATDSKSKALAVNDRGGIVGWSEITGGSHHAVFWMPLSATDLSFGPVLQGTTSDKASEVKNAGSAPLTISAIGSLAAPFGIVSGTCTVPKVLSPTESCTVVVRFSPTAEGSASSSFTITTDDPEEGSLAIHLEGRGATKFGVNPSEGTIGSQVTITGIGFGEKKGKLLIGGVTTNITKWTDNEIKGTLSKVPTLDVPTDVVVQPKGQVVQSEAGTFTFRGPKITSVDPGSGVSGSTAPITILGNFFSAKKGKVTLGYIGQKGKEVMKSCKILKWVMDPVTNEGEIQFLVPKGLASCPSYALRVSNSVGSDVKYFGVTAP